MLDGLLWDGEGTLRSHECIAKRDGGCICLTSNLPRGNVIRLTVAALKELALLIKRAARLHGSATLSRYVQLCTCHWMDCTLQEWKACGQTNELLLLSLCGCCLGPRTSTLCQPLLAQVTDLVASTASNEQLWSKFCGSPA